MQGAVTEPSRETRVLGEYEVVVANVHGDIRQVVHGVADDLFSRIDALGGLNAPRLGIRETRRVYGRRLGGRHRHSFTAGSPRIGRRLSRPPVVAARSTS